MHVSESFAITAKWTARARWIYPWHTAVPQLLYSALILPPVSPERLLQGSHDNDNTAVLSYHCNSAHIMAI